MTGTISTSDLQEALEDAWDALEPDSEEILSNVALLPRLKTPDLPYKNNDGKLTEQNDHKQ